MLAHAHPFTSTAAFLLDGDELSPATLWSFHSWSWEPGIVLPCLFFLVLYVTGTVRRGRGRALLSQHCCFAAGWLTLALSLVSPLHELGEQLFSAHMLQHELMILIAAPLIAAAHPGVTCLWAFSPGGRVRAGKWLRNVRTARISRFLMIPLVAWLLHAVALWGWHLPVLYQATLRSDLVHALQHMSFFLSALLFWSALYGVGSSRMTYGAGTFYVFGTAVHCGALGALLTFSAVLWYPVYEQTTYRWHLSPLQDQQLGGLIMWVPSGVVFIVIGLVLFARWLAESDRRLQFGRVQAIVQQGVASHE